jgi:transcriptional regulator with PAS, ATPase and Fis domain
VVAATSRDLKAAVTAGTFRIDLFYRLNVFPVVVPPLRARREDIPILLEYFIQRYSTKLRKKVVKIEPKSLDLACSYSWPGNIRELQNVVERSMVLCENDTFVVDERWLIPELLHDARSPFGREVDQVEKRAIEEALKNSNGRVAGPRGAAVRLGIPPSTLESKLKSMKINKNEFKTF